MTPEAVRRAIDAALAETTRPSLICCKTIIGWGAPNKQGTEATHGAALGEAEVAAARVELDWPHPAFEVPDDIRRAWDARETGRRVEAGWTALLEKYRAANPDIAAEFERRQRGELPRGWRAALEEFVAGAAAKPADVATRNSSQQVLNALAPVIPELIGGSADLTGSNNTNHKRSTVVSRSNLGGNYLHYGVREFGMTAIMNGIALHGGLIPYSGTFLVFSDYARNAVRMAALMKQGVILVYTHDSIGLGEDGPTHQPIEHLWSLRIIPNMRLWRPCDTVETAIAWGDAIARRDGPTSLVLSRQALPAAKRNDAQLAAISRGGYVLFEPDGAPECVLIATGSEVGLALDAAREMATRGRRARVVSMPCTSLYDAEPAVLSRLGAPAGRAARRHRGRRARGLVALRRQRRRGDRHDGFWRLGAREAALRAFRFHPRPRHQYGRGSFDAPVTPGCAAHIEEGNMTLKVGINGYGRIGRNVLRALYEAGRQKEIRIVAVNDLGDAETNAYLTRHDTVHGRFRGEVRVDGDYMVIDGDKIRVLAERDPAKLPWGELGVDTVFECTGLFTSKAKAGQHLVGGAKRVILSAPGEKDVDATIVYGVNHKVLKSTMTVISNASCTTNCLVPLVKPLHDAIGVKAGIMTTIHSYTNDQVLTDVFHKDLRRARSATMSMIPAKTGAAAAVGLVLPELNGKLDGFAVRVPTINVSLVDLTFTAARATSIDEVNKVLRSASQGELKGILNYSDGPLVSVDFNHDPASSTYDATLTKVIDGTLVKVCSWYDNEWGFSNRMLDTALAWSRVA